MSEWDQIGALIERLGTHPKLTKPQVRISWYDHDGQAVVEVENIDGHTTEVETFMGAAAPGIMRGLRYCLAKIEGRTEVEG